MRTLAFILLALVLLCGTANAAFKYIDKDLQDEGLDYYESATALTKVVETAGGVQVTGDLTSTANITATAGLFGATLNTGQGNYELYAMNQNVQTTDDVQLKSLSVSNNLSSIDATFVGKVETVRGTVGSGLGVFPVGANAFSAIEVEAGEGGIAYLYLTADQYDNTTTDRAIIRKNDSGTLDFVNVATQGLSMGTDGQLSSLNLTASGAVSASKFNSGLGFFEIGQDLQTTDAVTFATVDTGQGANELYDMNQNVQTTDNVTFGNLTVSTEAWIGAQCLLRDNGGGDFEFSEDSGSSWSDVGASGSDTDWTESGGTISTDDMVVMASWLTVDSSSLVVNADDDYVGIGTASPRDTLHVVSNADIDGNLSVDTVNARTIAGSGSGAATIGNLNVTSNLTVNGGVVTGDDVFAPSYVNPTELSKQIHFYIDDDRYPHGATITNFMASRNLTQAGDLSANCYIGTYGKAGFTADSTAESLTFTENLFVIEDNGTIDNATVAAGKYIVVDVGKAATALVNWQVILKRED